MVPGFIAVDLIFPFRCRKLGSGEAQAARELSLVTETTVDAACCLCNT